MPRKPRQRPTAAPGETPSLQGAKSPSVVLYTDAAGYVVRAQYGGAFDVHTLRTLGIPIDPSEWCAASHDLCDANPAVTLPPWVEIVDNFGTFPMRWKSRRATNLCVECEELLGWQSSDWSAIEELRAERLTARQAA